MTEEFGAYSTVFVRRQLEALSELQPFVACWVRSNPEVFDHEAIHVLRSESPLRRACAQLLSHLPNRFTLWQRILAAGEMRRLLRRYRPRHLLIHFGWAAARVVGVLEEEGVPFTLFFHGSDLNEAHAHPSHPYARRLLRAARLAQRCLCVSHDLAHKLIELGVREERVEVFYLGVPVPPASALASPRPEEGGRIVANGRLIEWKGHRYLLDAMGLLAERGLRPRLALIGEGRLQTELEEQAARLGIREQLELIGHCSNERVFELLRQSDLLAHPSLRLPTGEEEGLGLAVQEAMATGLPVVATRTGGIPESVEEDVSGLLVPPADAEAMANSIERLLRDGELCRNMGKAGRARIEAHFDLEKRNAELLERMRAAVRR
jgi:colanic acid/amylovoran biosynthesis glycosyltransferase